MAHILKKQMAVLGLLLLLMQAGDWSRAWGGEAVEDRAARVATVAMHSELGDYETNLKRIRHWANKAKKSGATFVVFPELCVQRIAPANSRQIPEDNAVSLIRSL